MRLRKRVKSTRGPGCPPTSSGGDSPAGRLPLRVLGSEKKRIVSRKYEVAWAGNRSYAKKTGMQGENTRLQGQETVRMQSKRVCNAKMRGCKGKKPSVCNQNGYATRRDESASALPGKEGSTTAFVPFDTASGLFAGRFPLFSILALTRRFGKPTPPDTCPSAQLGSFSAVEYNSGTRAQTAHRRRCICSKRRHPGCGANTAKS